MEAHQDNYNLIMEDPNNTMIIKRKRTKRPRSSSPLALTMASTSSTTSEETDTENPNNGFLDISTNNSIKFTRILQEHNNDEEDMANCLILLAQGQASPSPSESHAYECKTCNRGFASFQALGGHRASHKKPPKPILDDGVHHSSTTLSLHIGSNQEALCNPSGSIKPAKVHECSICGAEFSSGQALGGHMRRHRSMPMAVTASGGSRSCQESKKPKTLLSLDLNLPAPVEDDLREKKLPFHSKDQMIVFSNSSLVHCHF